MWRHDWPREGAPIDPVVDDLPHLDCGTEWWYFHCHVTDEAGVEHGVMIAFFRHRGEDVPDGHFAVASRAGRDGAHVGEMWMDRGLADTLRIAVDQDTSLFPGIRQAYLDATAGGALLLPDRLMPEEVTISDGELDLRFGGISSLRKLADGAYHLVFGGANLSLELTMSPQKPPVVQGGEHGRFGGPSHDGADELFSYFTPKLRVHGQLDDVPVTGSGWFEHTFGGSWFRVGSVKDVPDRTWTWLGIQLDNGHELVTGSYEEIDRSRRRVRGDGNLANVYGPDGMTVCAATVEVTSQWTSLSSLTTYPARWLVSVPEAELELVVEHEFPGQELRMPLAQGAFVEGWASARGTMAGQPVSGRAFGEVVPSNRYGRMEDFLSGLRTVTQDEIRALYPDVPGAELTASLVGSDAAGLPHQVVHETLVRPMRHITDPGGRGWRTFATCAALELFDVRADPYRPLLAVIELTHSGSMIIDDIGDESVLRRGVPATHLTFGTATAMNAGTAAYFAFDRVAATILPDDDRLRLRAYQAFLRGLRAAHAGQGIDIAGHDAAMDLALSAGESEPLRAAVRAGMRLKSGAPARGFAEVGALIARASDEQFTAIGDYFEAVGLAYQITDDVLDVLGAAQGSAGKHQGEDMRAGKVTMPLAHGIGRLSDPVGVWAAVRDGKADEHTVRAVARELVDCGAVQACYDEAREHVDKAWAALDPLLPNTFTKMMVHALGFYAAMREPDDATGE